MYVLFLLRKVILIGIYLKFVLVHIKTFCLIPLLHSLFHSVTQCTILQDHQSNVCLVLIIIIIIIINTNQLGMSDLMTKKIKAGRRSSTVMASAESVE